MDIFSEESVSWSKPISDRLLLNVPRTTEGHRFAPADQSVPLGKTCVFHETGARCCRKIILSFLKGISHRSLLI